MIARTWRGAVRAADAEAYAAYIRDTGLAGYVATPGNLGAWLMYRIEGDRVEVRTLRTRSEARGGRARGCRAP